MRRRRRCRRTLRSTRRGCGPRRRRRCVAAGPATRMGRCGRRRQASMPRPVEQLVVERRLERADSHPAAVRRAVGAVERCAAVEQVAARPVLPGTGGEQSVEHRREVRGAVDHGGVDDLADTGHPRLVQRSQQSDDQVGGPGEVTEHVQRRHRRVRRRRARAEGTGDGDVGDVVAGSAARRDRPGPSRSSARRPGAGCARPGTRRVRPRAARRRRDACLRARRSARATRSSTRRTSSASLRSSATDRLPRPRMSRSGGTTASAGPPGRSMRTTSAPRSASSMPANGAGADAGKLDDAQPGKRSGHVVTG